MKITKIALATTIVTAAVLALSACSAASDSSSSGSDGSRAKLYSSIDALSSDSSLIVTGTVVAQSTVKDQALGDYTLSTLKVALVVPSAHLAQTVSAPAATVSAGTSVQVRQLGTKANQSTAAPLLATGESYLLFLASMGLADAPTDQFYVTGGSAGIYQANSTAALDAASTTFTSKDAEGDNLPATLSPSAIQ